MKTLLLSTLLAVGLAGSAVAQNYHRGYVTRNGTYVAPHWQSTPDRSYNNNWSVRPNVNPYTGRSGTRSPTFNDRSPSYNRQHFGTPMYQTPSYGGANGIWGR